MLQLHPPLSLSTLEENMVSIAGGLMEIQGVNIKLDDFELCRYLVSQQLWYEVVGQNPGKLYFKNAQRPVERVSWDDIHDEFLPALLEKTADTGWCLPTEAQWEYAASGGKYARTYTYAGSEQLKETGWYNDNSYRETNPAACKRPNSLGLYDMSGNLREWCRDWYDSDYYQKLKDQYANQCVPNSSGPKEGTFRLVRMGSWFDLPEDACVSNRLNLNPYIPSSLVGFRLCRYSAC